MMYTLVSVWWKALRYHFTPCSVLPGLLGFAATLSLGIKFNYWHFFLVILALVLNHIALNMTDDYFDYLNGADTLLEGEKNAYSGGSGVLVAKEISPIAMYYVFIGLYLSVIVIGLYLTIKVGFVVLILGFIGVFSSFFYTAPPLKYSYCGLGELAMLINLGPVIGVGAYYVATKIINFDSIMLSIPLGILMFSQILANELPDHLADKKVKKNTLVVYLGKEIGWQMIIISMLCAYLVIVIDVMFFSLPMISLLALCTVPLAYIAGIKLKKSLNLSVIDGNLEIMKVHDYIGLLLIFSFCIQSIMLRSNMFAAYVILFTTIFLYFPVWLKFSKN